MMPLSTSSAPRRKLLLMQQFISLLLVFRVYLRDIHTAVFYAVLCGFFVGKYIREGNTVGSVLQYVALLLVALSDLLDWGWLANASALVAVLNYIFVAPCIYTLPEYKEKVGLRDHYTTRNNNQFYYAEWFPVVQDENCENYQIPWNHTTELKKMAIYQGYKPTSPYFKFFNSWIAKYKLTLAKGTPDKYRGVILFSHGRGCTPFMCSSILKNFARTWKILSPQHSDVNMTPYTDLPSIKLYREIEVQQRAEDIIHMASRVKEDEPIVLMGHSYGCATILLAYKKLHLSIRKRVSHIILLDPWLFPLTTQVFQDEIICPVLMLANQYFVNTRDTYERNKKFVERHGSRLVYFCWQGGDHLHQTDFAFIRGTSEGYIKNAKLCAKYHDINTYIII